MSERKASPEEAPETRGRTIRFLARFYDAASWLMSFGRGAAMNRDIVEMAGIQPGERVLDAGCGTGAQTFPAAERACVADVTGIDASPEMIEIARRKARKKGLDVDFRVAAAEDLPFGDGEFDVVLSGFMLHHLPDDVMRKVFTEVRRVLRPGARFLAVDMSSRGSLVGHIIRLCGHAHSAEGVEHMKQILEEVGFREVADLDTKYKDLVFLRAKKAND